jgi:hypothetical protein
MKISKKEGLEIELEDLYATVVVAFICSVFKMFM